MKRRLLDLIACPVCRERLDLTVFAESKRSLVPLASGPACRSWCERERRPLHPASVAPDAAVCGACYASDVEEAVLTCAACTLVYPVIAGVPRLVRNARAEYAAFFHRYRAAIAKVQGFEQATGHFGKIDPSVYDERSNRSFSLQWANQVDGEKTWFKDDATLRKHEFLRSLDIAPEPLRGALVLDAGCGNGRLAAHVAEFGTEIVAMDLSSSVEQANAKIEGRAGARAPFVHYVQGNVLEPPFPAVAFDHVHASGVLHHTPDSERALRQLLTTLRPGGRVYVQLYRRREAWVGVPNTLIRSVTSRLPTELLYRLCWLTVPLHTALVRLVARLRGESSPIGAASRGERALSLFDNFSPRYQHRYRPEQVRRMFEAAGLGDVNDTTLENEARHMVAFVGVKHGSAAACPVALPMESRRGIA
jgi:SAM-dependent methyltransferase/uncharacterized protein YbaR (Trm112 family)